MRNTSEQIRTLDSCVVCSKPFKADHPLFNGQRNALVRSAIAQPESVFLSGFRDAAAEA